MYPTARARARRVGHVRWLRGVVAATVLVAQFVAYTQVSGQGTADAESLEAESVAYLSPATAAMLTERAILGEGGIRVGDLLEYVIDPGPLGEDAASGSGRWVVFYPSPGTEVVGAALVVWDGNDLVDAPAGTVGWLVASQSEWNTAEDPLFIDESSPLPDDTAAVRFAIGDRAESEGQSVRVRVRISKAPASCLQIDTEIRGGDTTWDDHVPSPSTTNVCLALSQSGPADVPAGDSYSYSVKIVNISPAALTNVAIVDTLDSETGFVSTSDGGSEFDGVVSWPTIESLAPGEGRGFTVRVTALATSLEVASLAIASSDQAGPVHTAWKTAIVSAEPPSLLVARSLSLDSVPEPGGTVTFGLTVTNTSSGPLELLSLFDDVFGDLLDATNVAVSANTCAERPRVLAAGSGTACSFDAFVAGSFGNPSHLDTVTAIAEDGTGVTVSHLESATVAFLDTLPAVVVTQLASPAGVGEPGDTVLFGLTLTNSSLEPVTVVSLSGDLFGDLLDPENTGVSVNSCSDLSATIVGGAVFACSFEASASAPVDGGVLFSTVALSVQDDDGNRFDSRATTAIVLPPASTVGEALHEAVADDDPTGSRLEPGSISGTVFLDLDGDPARAANEPGFDGTAIELRDTAGSVVMSGTTTADGSYEFSGVDSGEYTIVATAIGDGYDSTGAPGGEVRPAVIVTPGTEVSGIDLGLSGTASVGDTAWLDDNEDGVVDSDEEVLSNAGISLVWAGWDGILGTADDLDFGTKVSDANGHYLFDKLPRGRYQLRVRSDQLSDELAPTTATAVVVTLRPGEVFVLADFGFNTVPQVPFAGFDIERLSITATLLIVLGLIVLADGRRRQRRFDLAIDRI